MEPKGENNRSEEKEKEGIFIFFLLFFNQLNCGFIHNLIEIIERKQVNRESGKRKRKSGYFACALFS